MIKKSILSLAALAMLFIAAGTEEKEEHSPDIESGFLGPVTLKGTGFK